MAKGFNLTATINLQGPTNIKQVVNNINKQLGSINANVNLNINAKTAQSIAKVNQKLQTLNQTLGATTQSATTATQAFNNLAAAMASVGKVNIPSNIPSSVNNITSSVSNASKVLGQTRTEFEDFGRQAGLAVRRFAAFSTVTSVIYSFSNAMSKGVQQYIEFDKQVTRLSQVTNESKASLGSLVGEITRLSTGLGVASEDLATVSVTLAQAGFTAQDTKRALEALAKSALAPSFDNLNQTVEGSIALMRQFGISAGELEGALGSVNAVAAAFAVEASDIIAAIQRTGGVFASASKGVSEGTDSLNEFIAVFTSIRATTRESAETIATGLRTIFTRIQRSDTVEALKEYGVVLTDLEGKFVGPYEAVRRLSEGLSGLDPRNLKFSQIIEELGGFRQIGKVLPLIQQFAVAQDALKVAQAGQGSLATDAAKGQLALAVQIQQVREEFSALIRSIGDGKGFQTLVRLGLDLASALIQIADATKGVLPLIGIMAAFRGVSAISQFAGGFGGGLTGGKGNKASQGGYIHRFAKGGIVPGSGNRDSVPAMLTPGEVVMNKGAVQKYGAGNLVRMNRYSPGGKVKDLASGTGGKPDLKRFYDLTENFDVYEKPKIKREALDSSYEQYSKRSEALWNKASKIYQSKGQDQANSYLSKSSELAGMIQPLGYKELRPPMSKLKLNKIRGALAEKDIQDKYPAFERITNPRAGADFWDPSTGTWVEVKNQSVKVSDKTLIAKALLGIGDTYGKERKNNKKDTIENIDIQLFSSNTKDFTFSRGGLAQQLRKGGAVQRFELGGEAEAVAKAQRRVGYIDYDVIANEANQSVVEKGMAATGSTGPRIYTDYLTQLAIQARKSQSIGKLRAIYGVAGAGKTTLARGQGTDNGTLRKTERFPILSPEDIAKATEVLILSSTVSKEKMNSFFGDVDRAYTLSSTTPEERQAVKSRKTSRDITGIGLENRQPGATAGVSTDSALGEAMLQDRLGKKSVVLGRSESGKLRRKKGDELVEIIKKRIGVTWGGFAPTTLGHESIVDSAAAMGIPPEDFVALVGANEGIENNASSYRTAILDQSARVLIAKAGFGAKGATVLPKARDFEVPQAFDITKEGAKRRSVLLPDKGSTVFVGDDKTKKDTDKYENAGYEVSVGKRKAGVSGTIVRDLIASGNLDQLQSLVSPGVFDLLSKNMGRIQNRANVLPSIVEQVAQSSSVSINEVEKQIEALGIKRIESKRVASEPEYAAQVEVLKELREKKKKIQSSASFEPYRLLDLLAKSQPEKYALDLSTSSITGNVPEMNEAGQSSQAPIPVGRVAQLAQEKNKSIQAIILEQLGALGGPAGVKQILGIGSGDRTLSSLLQAGNIKAGKNLGPAADYINKTLAAKGIADAAEVQRLEEYQAKALHFGIAGLLPMDYKKEFEWDIGGTDIYATARGFGSTYLEEAKQMQKESSELAQKFAENVQNKSIFGGGEKLAFDFDKTLVEGADILDAKGNPDIPKYSDRTAVKEALKNARPTRLGVKLRSLVEEDQQDPPFIKKTRILTARPQSTADLLAQSLQSFGLPYATTDITGVSGGASSNIAALKAANLQKEEKLIDDNLDNIRAAKKAGKKGFQYVEPLSTTSELDEKMGQGNIEGAIIEKALAILGAPVRADAKQNRAIDYPDGLGSAAQFFPGIDPNIPTEVKRTIDGTSLEKVREEIARYISGGAEAVKLASGGMIQRFAIGGKPSRGVDIDKEFMKNPMPSPFNKVVSKKLGPEVYDLEKSSGLSSFEFDETKRLGDAAGDTIEQFKERLAIRIQAKKQRSQIKIDPSSMAQQLMPQTKPLKPELKALADSLQDTSNNIGYRPSALENIAQARTDISNATRYAVGGIAEAGQKKEKEYGKISITEDTNMISAGYLKSTKENSRQGHATASKLRDNLYYVGLSSATKGYGPRLYDVLMEAVTEKGGMLTSDRSSVSGDARKVWEYYFKNRGDVKKTPLEPKDWTQNEALLDPKLYGRKETWPPADDPAWILQSGYSKNPSLIKGPDVVRPSTKPDSRAMALSYFSARTPAFADGGSVPALVSNGEAYVPPALARRIGPTKLNNMNQADRNGMGRFSRGGGISVFKGPGSGTSDSIPASLPVGSFIIREKATKALGFNNGGSVGARIQRFAFGGGPRGPAARPDTISLDTIGATDQAAAALKNVASVLIALGVSSSKSAQLLNRGYQATAAEANKAYEADLLMAKAAGASADVLYDLEKALEETKKKAESEVAVRKELGDIDGGDLQNILSDVEDRIKSLTETARAGAQSRGLSDEDAEKEVRDGASGRRAQAFEEAATSRGTDLSALGANGNDLERVINNLTRDAKTLEQMNRQYAVNRRAALAQEATAAGDIAKAARIRAGAEQDIEEAIKNEIQSRRNAVQEVADRGGARGPNERQKMDRQNSMMLSFGVMTVGNIIANNISTKSNMASAGISGAVRGGSEAFSMTNQVISELDNLASTLTSAGGRAAQFGSLLSQGLKFAPYIQAIAILGQAAIDAHNAMRQFAIDLEKSKIERALDGLGDKFEKLNKDLNQLNLRNEIKTNLIDASRSADRLRSATIDTATVGWVNAIDVLVTSFQDAGGDLGLKRQSALRSQVLEKDGIMEYLKINSGDSDAYNRASSRFAGEQATESSASFKPIADGINQLIQARARAGESTSSLTSAPEFKDFAKSLVYADVALNKQIRQIELSTRYTEDEKQARIQEIISIEGANKIRLQAAIGQREAEQKSIGLLTSVYTRSLKRMFTNMEQAINAAAFSLKQMSDNVDLATAAITGQAKVGNIDLETSNVIQNPRAYSDGRVASAQTAAGSLFGSRAPEMSKLMNLGENVESTVMSTINKTLQDKGVDASNESIASAVDQSVRVELNNLGLPPELADKLAKEVGSTLVDLRSSGEDKVDFAKLSERLGSLNSVIDTAKDAQQLAIKALENYQNVLNQYSSNINRIIDLETSSRERSRKSIQISSDASAELAKSLGRTTTLSDSFARRDSSVSRQTGGLTDPDDIFQKILKLNTDRQVQQSSVKQAAEKGPAGIQDFVKFNNELSSTNVALRENRAALEEMANNTDKASAAMGAMQEAQQKAAGRLGFLEKVVTSTPEELESLNQSLYRLQRNMNGQQNTIQSSIGAQKAYRTSLEQGASAAEAMRAAQVAFSNERKETLGALQDILPFLGDSQQAGNVKANVLESMLQESGMGVSPLFQQVLNTLRNPEQDPATAAAMQYYQQATIDQANATRLLGELDNTLAQDIARLNSKLVVDGLVAAKLTFENSELKDIAKNVNQIVSIIGRPPGGAGAPPGGAGAPPAVGIATGGLVYASAGQLINFQPQGTDTVPAMLTPGEFVVNRKSTQANLPLLRSINSNKYNSGGSVGYYAGGGLITNWGKPDTMKDFDQISKKSIIKPDVPANQTLIEEGYKPFTQLPSLYTLKFNDNSPALPQGTSDPYSLANISLLNAEVIMGISPGLDYDGNKSYISNFDPKVLTDFDSPPLIKDTSTLYLGTEEFRHAKVSKLEEEKIKEQLTNIGVKRTKMVNFKPSSFSDGTDMPRVTEFPAPTKNRFSPNLRTGKSPGILTKGYSPRTVPVGRDTPIYKPWVYNRTLDPQGHMNTMAAAVTKLDFPSGPLSNNYDPNSFSVTGAGFYGRYEGMDQKKDMILGKQIQDQAKHNKENMKIYLDTLDFMFGADVYEKNGSGTAIQDRLRSLFDNQVSSITLTKPDLIPFDELKDATTAIVGQQSLEDSFIKASEVDRGAGSKIKFGLTKPPSRKAAPGSILPKPFTITDDVPVSKSYPFMINGDISDLGEDFKNKQKEEQAKQKGKVFSRLDNDNLKLTLPFDLNGSKPTIDIPIAYKQYTGELYDEKASKFDGTKFTTFLPNNIDATLFQKLDTSSHRLFTPAKYTAADILNKSTLKDPAIAVELAELIKMRTNNNPNVAAQTAKVSAGLELLFDPQNSYIKYPPMSGTEDVFTGKSDLPTKVNIGEFVLSKLEEFRGQVAAGSEKVAQVPGLKKGATFSNADLPLATSALIRGSMGLFGNLRLPGFPSGWLVKSGASRALRTAVSGNPTGAAGYMSSIFEQAGAYISQLQNRATTVPAYNALDNASTMITGAAGAFGSLAGGDTSLLKQFYEQKIQIADVFRSFGASVKFGKVSGMKLSPDWQNLLGNQLSGTKIKTVGRNGSLSESDLTTAIPENANVNDLVKVLFNPYNEFPNKSSRADLIQKFGNDLFNLRGPNRMPYFDRQTLSWIGDGLTRLKKWYGGDGDWLGQDYFFDTAAEPDNAARMSNFLSSLTTDGQQYYKSAQEAQMLFGLANSFGPLPGADWFTARGAVLPQKRATGGIIYAQNGGGPFVNFAPQGTDTVPAMLTPGEFVINRSATQKNLPLLKAINSNNYSSGGMINYLADGGTAKNKTWIGSDNLAVSALGWLGGMGEATGRAAYGAANVVAGAGIAGIGAIASPVINYATGSSAEAAREAKLNEQAMELNKKNPRSRVDVSTKNESSAAAFRQVGLDAAGQGAYSAVELGQAIVGQGPIQTGEQTALQIGDAARVESVRQGMGDTAAFVTEGAQTVGFVASQLAQMGAGLGMGTGSGALGAFARATSVVDKLSDVGTLAPILSKIPGMKALGGGAQAATAGVAKILHDAGEAMPTFKKILYDPTAKFLTEAGSVADNLDILWGAATNPTKAKALEEALEKSGGSWAKAVESIKPTTPVSAAATKASTAATATPTVPATKAADDVTDATIRLPKAQRVLVEDQVNKFRTFAQEARAQEIAQHVKWAEAEADTVIANMRKQTNWSDPQLQKATSEDLNKLGFDLNTGPPPSHKMNDDLIGDIINKQMDNDTVWQASRAKALQDAEKTLKNKEAIDAFRKGIDDPNIKFENRTWRDWSANKVRTVLEKMPKSTSGRLGLGLAALGAVYAMLPKPQKQPTPTGPQPEDLAPTVDLGPGPQQAAANAPAGASQTPSSPVSNAAANAAATKPRSIPNYYDELTYKEYVSRELAAGNAPPAPDKKLFTTAAFYGKDKDGSFRQTAYDRRATNIPQQAGDDKDPKGKTPFGGRNKESQVHARTAAFVGEPTGQFGINQDTKEGNAKIKEGMFPSKLEEAYGAEPMEGEESTDAENRAQKQASRKITGRKGIAEQYKSAYSFYRNRLGEYTYTNSVAYKSKDRFAQGKMKFTTDRVGSNNHLSNGGIVYASTGALIPYAPKGTDTVPAMLTPGEFVVNRASTQKNLPLLRSINSGGTTGYSSGGVVYLSDGGQTEKPNSVSHKPINPLTGDRTRTSDNELNKKYRINSGIYDYLTNEQTAPDWLSSLNTLGNDDNNMQFFDTFFGMTLKSIREATNLRALQDLSYDFVKGFKYRDMNKDNRLSGFDFSSYLATTDGALGLIDPDLGGAFQPKDLVKWNSTRNKLRAKSSAARVVKNLTPDLENIRDILSDQKPMKDNNNPEFRTRNHYESPGALLNSTVTEWKKNRQQQKNRAKLRAEERLAEDGSTLKMNPSLDRDFDNVDVNTVVKDIFAKRKTPDVLNLVDWLENNIKTVAEKVNELVPVPNANEDWDAASAERPKVILDLIKNGPEAFMTGMRGETPLGKGKSLIYSMLAQSARIEGINNLIKARSLFSGSDIKPTGDQLLRDNSPVYRDQTRTPENSVGRQHDVARPGQNKPLVLLDRLRFPVDESPQVGSRPDGGQTPVEQQATENRNKMAGGKTVAENQDSRGRSASAISAVDLWDLDKDGKISFEEYSQFSRDTHADAIPSYRTFSPKEIEAWRAAQRSKIETATRKLFDKIDVSGGPSGGPSGFIEPTEFPDMVGKPLRYVDIETDKEAKELGETLGEQRDPRGAQKLAYDKIDKAKIKSVKNLLKADFTSLYPRSTTKATNYLDNTVIEPQIAKIQEMTEPTQKSLALAILAENKENRPWGFSVSTMEKEGSITVKKLSNTDFESLVNKAYEQKLSDPYNQLHESDINYNETLAKSSVDPAEFATIFNDYKFNSDEQNAARKTIFERTYPFENELNSTQMAEEKERDEERAASSLRNKQKRQARKDLSEKILREELFLKENYFREFPKQWTGYRSRSNGRVTHYEDVGDPILGNHVEMYNSSIPPGESGRLSKPSSDQEQDYKDRLKDISTNPIYASNGMLIPYQPRGTDTVPAMLTPGEFVVNRNATQKNLPLLRSINKSKGGKISYYSEGGSTLGIDSNNVYQEANAELLGVRRSNNVLDQIRQIDSVTKNTDSTTDNIKSKIDSLSIPQNTNSTEVSKDNKKNTDVLKSEIVKSRDAAQKNSELTNLALVLTPYLTAEAIRQQATSMMGSRGYSNGGPVYASEGTLVNYQPRGTDTVPAMLTPGEFVVNRASTAKNLPLLRSINSGSYSSGGTVNYLQDGGLPNKPYYGPATKSDAQKAQRTKKLQQQIQEQEAEAFSKLQIPYSDTTSTEDIMEALKRQRDYPKNLDKYTNKLNTDSQLGLELKRFPRISEAAERIREQSKQPKPPTVNPFAPPDYGPGPAIMYNGKRVQSKAYGGVVYAQEGFDPSRPKLPTPSVQSGSFKEGVHDKDTVVQDKAYSQTLKQFSIPHITKSGGSKTYLDQNGREISANEYKALPERLFNHPAYAAMRSKATVPASAAKSIVPAMSSSAGAILGATLGSPLGPPGMAAGAALGGLGGGIMGMLGQEYALDTVAPGPNSRANQLMDENPVSAMVGSAVTDIATTGLLSAALPSIPKVTSTGESLVGAGPLTSKQIKYADKIINKPISESITPFTGMKKLGNRYLEGGTVTLDEFLSTARTNLAESIHYSGAHPEAFDSLTTRFTSPSSGAMGDYSNNLSRISSSFSSPEDAVGTFAHESGHHFQTVMDPTGEYVKAWLEINRERAQAWILGRTSSKYHETVTPRNQMSYGVNDVFSGDYYKKRSVDHMRETLGEDGFTSLLDDSLVNMGLNIEKEKINSALKFESQNYTRGRTGGKYGEAGLAFGEEDIRRVDTDILAQVGVRSPKTLTGHDRVLAAMQKFGKDKNISLPNYLDIAENNGRQEFLTSLFQDLGGEDKEARALAKSLVEFIQAKGGKGRIITPPPPPKLPINKQSGGIVYANNGMLIPYQPKGTDTVPAMLTPGEFVINRAATQKNLPLLKSINSGSNDIQQFAVGGLVSLLKRKNVNRMEKAAQNADRRNSWIGVNKDGKAMDKYGMPIDNPMDIRSSDVMSVNARSEKEALQTMRGNPDDFNEALGDKVERASVFLRKQKLNLDTDGNAKSDADIVLDELISQIGVNYKRFLETSYTKPSDLSVVDKAQQILDKMNGGGAGIPPGVVPPVGIPLPNGQVVNAQQLGNMTQLIEVKKISDKLWSRVNYLQQVQQNTKDALEVLNQDGANNQDRETFDTTTRDGTRVRESAQIDNIGISGPTKQGTQVLTAQNTWATDELNYIKAVHDEIMINSNPQQKANLASIPRPQPVLYDETTPIPEKFNKGGVVYAQKGKKINKQSAFSIAPPSESLRGIVARSPSAVGSLRVPLSSREIIENRNMERQRSSSQNTGRPQIGRMGESQPNQIMNNAQGWSPPRSENAVEEVLKLIAMMGRLSNDSDSGPSGDSYFEDRKRREGWSDDHPAVLEYRKFQQLRAQQKSKGGVVYASEGTLVNYQPRGTDTVPAMLTPGEFVVNAKSAQKNLPLLRSINSNNYATGGRVSYLAGGTSKETSEERTSRLAANKERVRAEKEVQREAKRGMERQRLANIEERRNATSRAVEDQKKNLRDGRKAEMQSRRDAVTTSQTQGISYKQARQQQSRPAPESAGGGFVTGNASVGGGATINTRSPQPQQQSIPQISPQTQQRVGMAAQAAFDPQNSGDMNKQLVIFGTLLTGVNQVVTQFGAVMQQLVAGASAVPAGGVNNNGGVSLEGISQFTTSFNNFVNQLQKLKIPEQININTTGTVDVNINGADALQQLLGGPLAQIINDQVKAAFSQRDRDDEKPIA